MGRLPAVLHALPLPADAPGVEGRPVPAAAARLDRRDHAGGGRDLLSVPRPLPPRRADGRRAAQPARAPLRGQHERRQGRAQARRVQEGADRRERGAARAPRAAASAAASGLGVVRTTDRRRHYTEEDAERKAASSPTPSRRSAAARLGRRGNEGPLLARSRPRSPSTSWRWTPTQSSSTGCTASSRRSARTGSSRSSSTSSTRRRASAGEARERQPLPERGRPDLTLCLAVLHHVSISGNVPVASFLDWLRDLGGATGDRVPDAGGPDGGATARAQA